ncbi:MAG: transporter substrate-binding domain-containing protein [Chloroflexota bacterium]
MKLAKNWLKYFRLVTWLLLGFIFFSAHSEVYSQAEGRATTVSATTLARIQQRGDLLVVGLPYDFPPFSYLDAEGQLIGFDVDLLKGVAATWGVDVEFVPVNPAELPSLLAGRAIDIGPIVWSDLDPDLLVRASENIGFSQSYFQDSFCLLNQGTSQTKSRFDLEDAGTVSDGTLNGVSDNSTLSSYDIGYITGAGTNQAGKLLIGWLSGQNRLNNSQSLKAELFPFREHGLAVSALKVGQIHELITFTSLCEYHSQDGILTIREKGDETGLGTVRRLWGLSGREASLRHLVNYSLQMLVQEGDYARYHRKWFPLEEPFPVEMRHGQWSETYKSLLDTPAVPTPSQPNRRALTSDDNDSKSVQTLRVGVPYDLPPFGFQKLHSTVVVSGQEVLRDELVGYNIELASALANRLTDNDVEVELVPITSQTTLPLLTQNSIDLAIGMLSPTWDGAQVVEYSEPYLRDRAALLVRRDSGIESHVDLAGKTVAFLDGNGAALLWSAKFLQLSESTPVSVTIDFLPFQEYSTALRALEAKQVDGLIGGEQLLTYAMNLNAEVTVVESISSPLIYSVGISPNKSAVRLALNSALLHMKQDGSLQELATRWFLRKVAGPVVPKPPLERSRRIERTAGDNKLDLIPPPTPQSLSVVEAPAVEAPVVEAETIEEQSQATPTGLIVSTTPFQIHTVGPGETLASLALRFYSDQSRWQFLYEANRSQIGSNPNVLELGMELIIPRLNE